MAKAVIVLVGPRAASLVERFAPLGRVVSVLGGVPDEFSRSARSAQVWYALIDDRPPETLDSLRAMREAIEEVARSPSGGEMIVVVVGSARCTVCLGVWSAVLDAVRDDLLRVANVMNLPASIVAIASLPEVAESVDGEWRDAERCAWLFEAVSNSAWSHLVLLSPAAVADDGERQDILDEEAMSELVENVVDAAVSTNLMARLDVKWSPLPSERQVESLGVASLEYPARWLEEREADLLGASVLRLFLDESFVISPAAAREALREEGLDGAAVLERLLGVGRENDVLRSLNFRMLDYEVIELAELPDRIRSWSTWLGRQHINRIAGEIDTRADEYKGEVAGRVRAIVRAVAERGDVASPSHAVEMLEQLQRHLDVQLARAERELTLEALAAALSSDAAIVERLRVENVTEGRLNDRYQDLVTAIRNRPTVEALAARFTFGGALLAGSGALASAAVLLGGGAGLALGGAVVSTAVATYVANERVWRVLRSLRDQYCEDIVDFHRGVIFGYLRERVLEVFRKLQTTLDEELARVKVAREGLSVAVNRLRVPDAAQRASRFRLRVDVAPALPQPDVAQGVLREMKCETDGFRWTPEPGEDVTSGLDAGLARLRDICLERVRVKGRRSLVNVLEENLDGARAETWNSVLRLARCRVPQQATDSHAWFAALGRLNRERVSSALGAPMAPFPTEFHGEDPDRLWLVEVRRELDLSRIPLLALWRRAYDAVENKTALHPGRSLESLRDPFARPQAPENKEGGKRVHRI